MYHIFFDDQQLSISERPDRDAQQNLQYKGPQTLYRAEEILRQGQTGPINVFHPEPEHIWDAFQRRYRIVEAAGGIVFDPQARLLMIKRLGKWDLPKGKIEAGERPDRAALREVREETGLSELKIDKSAATTYHTYALEGQPILKPTHWFYMKAQRAQRLTPQTAEQIQEARWMDQAEVRAALRQSYSSIRALLSPLG